MLADFDHILQCSKRYRRVIMLVIAMHSSLVIVAFYALSKAFGEWIVESFFTLLFVFLGFLLYITMIIDSWKYFSLGKKFVILCPDFYSNNFSSIIFLSFVTGLLFPVAYVFSNMVTEALISFGLLFMLLCIDKLLHQYIKKFVDPIRNLKILDNATCDDICNSIHALNPLQTLFMWISSKFFLDKIERFYEYSHHLSKVCMVNAELREIYDELSRLMDLEFVQKNTYDVRKGVRPSTEIKDRIIRIYRLEVRLLETLLKLLDGLVSLEVKLSLDSFVFGVGDIEYLKKLGEKLEKYLKGEINFVELYKELRKAKQSTI